jgi:hypothetical protein
MVEPETEIELVGDGPFLLPLCGPEVNVAVAEVIAVVQFTTMQGQRVDIPLPAAALPDLALAVAEAIRADTDPRETRQ